MKDIITYETRMSRASQQHYTVSYIVCTKNRREKLRKALIHIMPHLDKNQLLIVDQSNPSSLTLAPNENIKLIQNPVNHGLSQSRNLAIKKSTSELLAFTDDDCITTTLYHTTAAKLPAPMLDNDTVGIIFGRTLPYAPRRHRRDFCPCTFKKNSHVLVSTICAHWIYMGYGNNMIIPSHVVRTIGGFKPWLGAGALAESAEDAEFAIRSIIAGYAIAYHNDLLVYHDKWLTKREEREQHWHYLCGGIAAYGFYFFQGVSECRPLVFAHLYEALSDICSDMVHIVHNPQSVGYRGTTILNELIHTIKGIIIAFIYAKIIPIPEKENVVKKFYTKRAHNKYSLST